MTEPRIDPTAAPGAGSTIDEQAQEAPKPRAGKRARQPQSVEESRAEFEQLCAIPLSERTAKQNARIRTLANRFENTQAGQPQPTTTDDLAHAANPDGSVESKPAWQVAAETGGALKPLPHATEEQKAAAKAEKHPNTKLAKGAEKNAQTGPVVDSTSTASTTGEPAVSTAETAPRYVADEDVVRELAAGITSAREAGFSRAALADLLGMAGRNAIWRTEVAGKTQVDEIDPIKKLLARIKSGELKPPERKAAGSKPPRASRAELEAKLDAVAQLLHDEWRDVKPASFRDALADVVGAPKPQEEATS